MELKDFGLDAYESAAFVTLVKEGMCTAHVLSRSSGVPYGKVYPVLSSLEKKGFVQVFDGLPKRFAAVDPKIVFERVVEDKKKDFDGFKARSKKLVQTLGNLSARKPKEPLEAIRILEGYNTYLKLSIALHKEAKEEWLSITRLEIYKEHYDATRDCIKRGMSVKLLTFNDENSKLVALWRKIGAEVRCIDYVPTHFSVIDGQQVTIRILGEERYLAIWLRNKSLATHMKNYFNTLWKNARTQ